jgi:hypothetical protein
MTPAKASKIALPARPRRKPQRPTPAQRPQPSKRRKGNDDVRFIKAPVLPPERVEDVPVEQRIGSILDLKSHHCRWPIGRPGAPGFAWCGGTGRRGFELLRRTRSPIEGVMTAAPNPAPPLRPADTMSLPQVQTELRAYKLPFAHQVRGDAGFLQRRADLWAALDVLLASTAAPARRAR